MGEAKKRKLFGILPGNNTKPEPAKPEEAPRQTIELVTGNVDKVQTHLLSLINTHLVAILEELRKLNAAKANG